MTVPAMYISVAECDALLPLVLQASDQRRQAYEAADNDGRAIAIVMATADINAPLWTGYRASTDQIQEWPRVLRRDWRCAPNTDPSLSIVLDPDPSEDGSELVSGLPASVRIGCAIQAAHHAARSIGVDATRTVEEAVSRGMTSVSCGGQSQSFDATKASDPWSKLALETQNALARYKAAGVDVL